MISNKTIVITGGTSGIGREMVAQLAADNQVWVLARDASKLAELQNEFDSVRAVTVDLADAQAVAAAIEQLINQLSSVDVLINNAAQQTPNLITDADFNPDDIDREMALNFNSAARLCHGLLPLLKASGDGVIVNVNSALGRVPKTQSAIYNASKGALHIFSLSLAYQLAPIGIKVQQAYLPLVDTAMTTGRGSGKLSAAEAANRILSGIRAGKSRNYIGKVKLLMAINAVFPPLAQRIMKAM